MSAQQFDAKIYERDIYEDSVYDSWLRHSSERDVLEDVFRQRFREWCPNNYLNILELGCAVGSSARRIFKILKENNCDFSYHGIDPYEDQLNRFREWAPKNVRLTNSKTENFAADQNYDLVLAVHSLYYVDDLKTAIQKIHSLGKKAIIVHHGPNGINNIHEMFRSYVKDGPNIISTYKDIEKALNDLKIPYKLDIYDTHVNIVPCKKLDNDGVNMIKFFLEKTELPQNLLEEVSEFLKTKPDIMLQDVGYFFL